MSLAYKGNLAILIASAERPGDLLVCIVCISRQKQSTFASKINIFMRVGAAAVYLPGISFLQKPP